MFKHFRLGSLFLGLLFAIACDDPSGPDGAALVLDVVNLHSRIGGLDGDAPSMECLLRLEVRTTEFLRWRPSVLRFQFGPAGEVVDSVVIPVSTLAEHFGGDPIEAGQTRVAEWRVSAGFPFRLAGELRYTAGRHGTATFETMCGMNDTEGAPPVIESFSIESVSVEPGDAVDVRFELSGEVPLWMSRLIVSGAFHDTIDFPEYLRTDAVRLYHLEVPAGSALGEAVNVRLVTIDAALQQALSDELSSGPLVDVTPPDVTIDIGPYGPGCSAHFCQYGVGDELPVRIEGYENAGLAWLHYRIGEPAVYADSVSLIGGSATTIQVREEFVGQTRVRAWVSDVGGNIDADDDLAGETVYFHAVSPSVVRVDTIPGAPLHAVVDHERGAAYVVTDGHHSVWVVDLEGIEPILEVPLPGQPSGVEVTPDGAILLTALPDLASIGRLSLPANAGGSADLVELVPVHALDSVPDVKPTGIAVAADGRWIVTANHPDQSVGSSGKGRVVVVDPQTDAQEVVIGPQELAGYSYFEFYAPRRSGNHERLAVVSTARIGHLYDAATHTFTATGDLGNPREALATNYSGNFWTAEYLLFDERLQQLAQIPRRGDWMMDAVAPAWDGATVLRRMDTGVERLDPYTGLVLSRVNMPRMTRGWVYASADGSELAAIGAGFYYSYETLVAVAEDSPFASSSLLSTP